MQVAAGVIIIQNVDTSSLDIEALHLQQKSEVSDRPLLAQL